MRVLLVSSTQREINHYLQTGPKHDVLITGLGIAHTTYELTRQLSHHRYDLVLQVGVAGSYGFYNMGDVVVVSKDTFGDIGAFQNESFLSLQELGFQNNHQWFENKNPHLEKLDLPVAIGITVNTVTDEMSFNNAMKDYWKADIESMEGAALHMVCEQLNMPYLQVRSISNYVGERNKSRWKLQEAIDNLNNAIPDILQKINP